MKLPKALMIGFGVAAIVVAAKVWPDGVQAGVRPVAKAQRVLPVDYSDRDGDGMPDAMVLDSRSDEQAFRRWFTFLAEVQFFNSEDRRPREINDCAALIRYAYREALREHDSRWSAGAGLPVVLALPSVKKYQYPHTMLGAALFRVKPGAFRQEDLQNQTFAQFADAKTLQTRNTHFVSRDIARAQPGDLLFFRHESSDMPFHAMVYLGPSRVKEDGARYLVYHTGPNEAGPGEIRRPSVEELMAHPNPGWRPHAGNPTFLGVYRWNILGNILGNILQ